MADFHAIQWAAGLEYLGAFLAYQALKPDQLFGVVTVPGRPTSPGWTERRQQELREARLNVKNLVGHVAIIFEHRGGLVSTKPADRCLLAWALARVAPFFALSPFLKLWLSQEQERVLLASEQETPPDYHGGRTASLPTPDEGYPGYWRIGYGEQENGAWVEKSYRWTGSNQSSLRPMFDDPSIRPYDGHRVGKPTYQRGPEIGDRALEK